MDKIRYIALGEGTPEKRPIILQHSEMSYRMLLFGGHDVSKLIEAEFPNPTPPEGHGTLEYFNEITNEVFYEYVPIPLTSEQKIEQLEAQLVAAEEAKLTTLEAVAELYEMMNGAK